MRLGSVQPSNAVLAQVLHSIKFEKEFLVDQNFFLALLEEIPDIAEIRLDMKRGAQHSEFSMFRYDVTFWRADPASPRTPRSYTLTPYDPTLHSVAQLTALLAGDDAPDLLALACVPDARTVATGELLRILQSAKEGPEVCGELRVAVDMACAERSALEPEDLYVLGFAHGFHVEMMWSPEVCSCFALLQCELLHGCLVCSAVMSYVTSCVRGLGQDGAAAFNVGVACQALRGVAIV
jgi:hypothetical protein